MMGLAASVSVRKCLICRQQRLAQWMQSHCNKHVGETPAAIYPFHLEAP